MTGAAVATVTSTLKGTPTCSSTALYEMYDIAGQEESGCVILYLWLALLLLQTFLIANACCHVTEEDLYWLFLLSHNCKWAIVSTHFAEVDYIFPQGVHRQMHWRDRSFEILVSTYGPGPFAPRSYGPGPLIILKNFISQICCRTRLESIMRQEHIANMLLDHKSSPKSPKSEEINIDAQQLQNNINATAYLISSREYKSGHPDSVFCVGCSITSYLRVGQMVHQ